MGLGVDFPLYAYIRDANHSNYCGIILIFKAYFRIRISNVKISANNNLKMVPNKIMRVTSTSNTGYT